MNWAHVHLLINHIPVIGIVFGFLLLSYGIVRRSGELKRAGFCSLVLIAIVTIPVFLTGEPAEESVEHLPGISESHIEEHEEAAEMSMVTFEVLGLLALVSLVLSRRRRIIPSWLLTTCLILSLVVGVMMARTANLGGKIRHSEIRSEANGGN